MVIMYWNPRGQHRSRSLALLPCPWVEDRTRCLSSDTRRMKGDVSTSCSGTRKVDGVSVPLLLDFRRSAYPPPAAGTAICGTHQTSALIIITYLDIPYLPFNGISPRPLDFVEHILPLLTLLTAASKMITKNDFVHPRSISQETRSSIMAIIAYCLSSISMTIVNKYCVSGPQWSLNFLFLAYQVF